MLQGERGLDQSGHPRRRPEVADVGLHRADRAPAGLAGPPTEHCGQRGDLDRVAERGAGAVCLDVADRARVDPGHPQRLGDDGGLPVDARGGEADLVCAVVVDRVAEHDRADVVAVGQRVGQPLEHDHPAAAAPQRPGGVRVERPAVPVRRQDPAVGVQVAAARAAAPPTPPRPAPCRTRRSAAPRRPGAPRPARWSTRCARSGSARAGSACTRSGWPGSRSDWRW